MEKCPGVNSGEAGKAESCKGCPNANICASSKPDEDIPIIENNLKNLGIIVAVLSGKGGVGKSTISRNIASAVAKLGLQTILVDFDLSGPSIPRLTNTMDAFIHNSEIRFDPIVVEPNLKAISLSHLDNLLDNLVFDSSTKTHYIKKILKNCNFDNISTMIIDTPPNITDEHLALANFIKPTFGILVTTPQSIALNDVKRQISFCNKISLNLLGMIENMKDIECIYCNHINTFLSNSHVEDYCNSVGINYLGSIPLQSSIAQSCDDGKVVFHDIFDHIAGLIYKNKKI